MGKRVVNGPTHRCRGQQAQPGFGLQVEKMRKLERGENWGVGTLFTVHVTFPEAR